MDAGKPINKTDSKLFNAIAIRAITYIVQRLSFTLPANPDFVTNVASNIQFEMDIDAMLEVYESGDFVTTFENALE